MKGAWGMSFSSTAKEELCQNRIHRHCCRQAALSSWLQMSGSLQLGSGGKKKVSLTTESHAVARWGVSLAKSLYPIEAEIFVHERKQLGKHHSFVILLGGDAIEEMLFSTGQVKHTQDGIAFDGGVPEFVYKKECCKRAFLRGAFIGGGSVSNPRKGYHLEFVVRSEHMANDLRTLLDDYGLNAKAILRKGNYVVYLKESEKITELLTLIGAHTALFDLENVRIYKDIRNNLNRQVNCETANIQKTVTAVGRQIESIRYLIDHDAMRRISDELRETAEARINNPDATLVELCEMLSDPISKSGINHRLRKLDNIAQRLRMEKGDA